jgi:hypothetical protein
MCVARVSVFDAQRATAPFLIAAGSDFALAALLRGDSFTQLLQTYSIVFMVSLGDEPCLSRI